MQKRINLSENSKSLCVCFCIIIVVSLFYYLSYYNYGLNLSDEGYLVYGAKRVLSGQIPGADFHAYMPGRYVTLASLFKVFGTDILVERVMWVLVRVIIAALFFKLSTIFLPVLIALMPTFLIILIPGPWHKSFEMLFPLAWFLSVYFYLLKQDIARILLLALFAGATLFFRLENGLLVIFLSVLLIIQVHFFIRKTAPLNSDPILHCVFKNISLFFLFLFFVFFPYLIYLWFQSSVLKSFFFYAHELVAGISKGSNPFLRPLPSLLQLFQSLKKRELTEITYYFLYFFFFIYAATFGRLGDKFFKKKWGPKEIFLSLLAIYGVISLYQVVGQPDISHLLQT